MCHCGSTLNLPINLRQEGEVECGWTELLDGMQETCMHMHVDAAICHARQGSLRILRSESFAYFVHH